jgi:hypothetical protein
MQKPCLCWQQDLLNYFWRSSRPAKPLSLLSI